MGTSLPCLRKAFKGATPIPDQGLTSANSTISGKQRPAASPLVLRWGRTIRGQILLAFLFMAAVGTAVGLHASYRIEHGGALVGETYDGPLMAINYARAASADFALMQVAALRLARAPDQASRSSLEIHIGQLKRSLIEDLEIAADRSRSPRADQAAKRALAGVEAWDQARQTTGTNASGLDQLAPYIQAVDREMELLVNQPLSDELIEQAAVAAGDIAKPMDNTDFELVWRKRMVRTLVANALKEVRGDDMRAERRRLARMELLSVPIADRQA